MTSIAETLENIKTFVLNARRLGYAGAYDDSVKAFDKSLETIRKLCKMVDDEMIVNTWSSVARDLESERDVVNGLKSIVTGLRNEAGREPMARQNNEVRIRQNNSPIEEEANYVVERPIKNQWGFRANKDRMEEENKNKDDYCYVQKRRERQRESENSQRDPDVWGPPSPKEGQAKRVVKAAAKVDSRAPKGRARPEVENKKNVKKGNQSNEQNKENPKEKKSFLYHCYPDGKGPDAELIQMLERDIVEQSPNVKFDDIASLADAKQLLQEAAILPIYMPNLFRGVRTPWSGVLLFGPPGTGKTLLAKAVATESKTSFFNITAASLASKYRGESERLVRLLFEIARYYAPTTIFLDEIDALGSERGGTGEHEASRRVLTELLVQMSGVSTNNASGNDEQRKTITVIGATNRPWDLDIALRRRLEKRIYIPLPDEVGREALFKINLRGIELDENVNIEALVKNSEGYSGADIALLCREASMMPIRKRLIQGGGIMNQLHDIEKLESEMDVPITANDFKAALNNVPPSVGNTDLDNYTKWKTEFGCSLVDGKDLSDH